MFKIAAAFTTFATLACMAQPGLRTKSQLSLTDSQMQNIRGLREQHRQATQASMEELHTKERALREQLKAGNQDAATLGRLLIDIEASRRRVDSARQTSREQIVNSLTAEQKTRLKVLEDARSLAPAIREAEMLGLLDSPAGPGRATDGGRMMRGPFGRGPVDADGAMGMSRRGGPRPERRNNQ